MKPFSLRAAIGACLLSLVAFSGTASAKTDDSKAAERFAAARKLAGDVTVKAKTVRALRAELDVTLVTPLAVVADIDAWLSTNDPAGAPATPAPK